MINYFIFFFIVVLVIILNNREYFSSTKEIEFISPKNACVKLKTVRYTYNPLDIKLRQIDPKYKGSLYKFYCDNLLEFSNLDKKLLRWLIDGTKKRIRDMNLNINLLFILENTKIAKFEDNVDNGYPHTNGDIVFLTSKFINSILPFYNGNDINGGIKNIGSILIHEGVHIWQRRNPEIFNRLYTKYWFFIKADKIHNKQYLDKITRYNPDGTDTDWVFHFNNKYFLFLSIYEEGARDISGVRYVGIELNKIDKTNFEIIDDTEYKSLIELNEFNSFFSNIYGNHYHPNELSAELMSIYYLKIMKLSHKKFNNTAYSNMVVWLKEVLD